MKEKKDGSVSVVNQNCLNCINQEDCLSCCESDQPLDKQVGGKHYKDFKIQPIEFFMANNTPYAEAAVIKYVLRYKNKGGKEDLKKAIHFCELLIEENYG